MAKDTKTSAPAADHSAASIRPLKIVVEKSLSALNDLNAESKTNVEAVVASTTAATQGLEALRAQIMAFGKQSLADNIAATKALSGARSLEEVVELQTSWAKSAMAAYVTEFNKASETITASFSASVAPINERITASVGKFQGRR